MIGAILRQSAASSVIFNEMQNTVEQVITTTSKDWVSLNEIENWRFLEKLCIAEWKKNEKLSRQDNFSIDSLDRNQFDAVRGIANEIKIYFTQSCAENSKPSALGDPPSLTEIHLSSGISIPALVWTIAH